MSSDTALWCDVVERGPAVVIELVGSLRLDTVSRVRLAVEKTLAQPPDVVVLDTARLGEVEKICVSMFAVVGRLAAERGVPLVLAAPSASLRRVLCVTPMFVRVVNTRAEAKGVRGLPGAGQTSVTLPRELTAAKQARDVVERSCADSPARLGEDAVLVANELVSNALEHVEDGPIELTVRLLRHYVHIEVRDGHPKLDGTPGLGLTLVASVSARWGWKPVRDGGKVVWADLLLPDANHGASGRARGVAPGLATPELGAALPASGEGPDSKNCAESSLRPCAEGRQGHRTRRWGAQQCSDRLNCFIRGGSVSTLPVQME
jgi:anti-sigma regulatory factor (Ser/Thr protein kinase)/anti-anti-sigma regulatory factor